MLNTCFIVVRLHSEALAVIDSLVLPSWITSVQVLLYIVRCYLILRYGSEIILSVSSILKHPMSVQLKPPNSEAAIAPSSSSTVPTSESTSSQAGETMIPQSGQGVMSSPGAIPPNMLGMMPGMLPGMIPGMPGVGMPNLGALSNYDAVKRAQEFAMRLGFHQVPFGMPLLPTMIPTHLPEEMGGARNVKAPVLRLDAHGREVDEHGNVVERSKVTNVSTLKVRTCCHIV